MDPMLDNPRPRGAERKLTSRCAVLDAVEENQRSKQIERQTNILTSIVDTLEKIDLRSVQSRFAKTHNRITSEITEVTLYTLANCPSSHLTQQQQQKQIREETAKLTVSNVANR